MITDFELMEGLRIARIIDVAERNKITWQQAEQVVKQNEREEFFNESVLDEVNEDV